MRPITLALCATALLSPVAAAAAPAGASAGGAKAAPSAVTQDARCLLTMTAFTKAKDPNTAAMAQLGVVYFAGRIKARDPSFSFAARLQPLAASMNGQPLQAEANRCGPMVLGALRELQSAFPPPPGAAGATGGAAKPPTAAPPVTTTPPPKP